MLIKTSRRTCLSRELIYTYIFFWVCTSTLFFVPKILMIFIVLLYLFSTIGYFQYKKFRFEQYDKWLRTDAEIVDIGIVQCICFSNFKVRQNKDEIYKPHISYRYTYKEKPYISDQYAISYDDVDCNFNFTKNEASRIINSLSKKAIKIYVHQDTGRSAISLDISKGYAIPYIGLIISYILFGYLAYQIYYW